MSSTNFPATLARGRSRAVGCAVCLVTIVSGGVLSPPAGAQNIGVGVEQLGGPVEQLAAMLGGGPRPGVKGLGRRSGGVGGLGGRRLRGSPDHLLSRRVDHVIGAGSAGWPVAADDQFPLVIGVGCVRCGPVQPQDQNVPAPLQDGRESAA